jgi:hypothetical protein
MVDITSAPKKIVRDALSGRVVEVRGFGALKGRLTIKKGVDLTKPIYDQVTRKSHRSDAKRV